MLTGGKLGFVPEAYPLIRAARYYGVPPWELAQQPIIWQQWALIFEAAESDAKNGPQVSSSTPAGDADGAAGNAANGTDASPPRMLGRS